MELKSVVPEEITELELNFMKTLNPGITDDKTANFFSYIPVAEDTTGYEYDCCQSNVQKKISKDGGYPIIGWSIWKSQLFLEAEYHHVWSSSDGSEVIDITPKRDGEKYILFVIDPEQKDDGLPVCNKRQVLLDIPEVHKLKELFIKHAEIRRKAQVPFTNYANFTDELTLEYNMILKEMGETWKKINDFLDSSSSNKN